MTTTDTDTPVESVESVGFIPPYGSFKTLNNLFDRMAEEGGIPARIDRSYLSNLPGSVIATTTHALKVLGLVDQGLHPTPALVEVVENPDERKSLLAGIIREKYRPQLALGSRATTNQLEASFRELGASGSTVRKAIAFFLAAARFAEVPISPYFKTPKPVAGEKKPVRKPAGQTDPNAGQTPLVPHPDPSREALKGLDPFIQGLVRSLPEPGAVFPPETQEAWFDTARGIFKLLYKTGAPASADARQPVSPNDEGESD